MDADPANMAVLLFFSIALEQLSQVTIKLLCWNKLQCMSGEDCDQMTWVPVESSVSVLTMDGQLQGPCPDGGLSSEDAAILFYGQKELHMRPTGIKGKPVMI